MSALGAEAEEHLAQNAQAGFRRCVGSGPGYLAGLITAWAVFFLPLLVTGRVPVYRDLLRTHIPVRDFMRSQLLSGHLPLWFPFECMGEPLFGQLFEGLFHPTTLLYLIWPTLTALKIEILLLHLSSLLLFYAFLRKLGLARPASACGALVYAFCGYSLSMTSNLTYLRGIASMPLLGWFVANLAESARIWLWVCGLSLGWAMVLLGGDVQAYVMAAPLLVAVLWGKRRLKRVLHVAVAGALSIGIASIELVPSYFVREHGLRSMLLGYKHFGTDLALHPLRVPAFLFGPWIRPNQLLEVANQISVTGREPWATSLFVGSVGLSFALMAMLGFARRTRGWTLIFALSIGMALGSRAGMFDVVLRLIPFLSNFRYPEKYVAVAMFALAVLAAYGTELCLEPGPLLLRCRSALLLVAMPAVILALVSTTRGSSLWLVHRLFGAHTGAALADEFQGNWLSASLVAVVGIVPFALRHRFQERGALWANLMAGIAALQLWSVNSSVLLAVDPDLITQPTAFCKAAADAGAGLGHQRVVSTPSTAFMGAWVDPDRWVLETMNLLLPDTSELCGIEGALTSYTNLPGTPKRMFWLVRDPAFARKVAPLFDTNLAVAGEVEQGSAAIAQIGSQYLTFRRTAGRAYAAVPQWVAKPHEALDLLHSHGLELLERPVLEGSGPTAAKNDQIGDVKVVKYEPNEVVLEANLTQPGAVVLNDMFYPGWNATLDGRPTPVYPANVVARAVYAPAGSHRVVFRFLPIGFKFGAWVSTLTLFAMALGCGLVLRRSQRGRRGLAS